MPGFNLEFVWFMSQTYVRFDNEARVLFLSRDGWVTTPDLGRLLEEAIFQIDWELSQLMLATFSNACKSKNVHNSQKIWLEVISGRNLGRTPQENQRMFWWPKYNSYTKRFWRV